MSYDGLSQAKEDFGIDFQYVEPESASDFEAGYRQFADAGVYDLIIGLATDQNDALTAVQADYPDFTERQIGLRRFSDVLRALEKEKLLKLETDEGGNMLVHIL